MSNNSTPPGDSKAGPGSFSDTDLCVKCGLCLPHCPTYVKTLDESESPRGRLSLIQGWAAGQLAATPKLLGHIDNCLLCRACEIACPANVPYGRLIDDFRDATSTESKSVGSRTRGQLMRSILNSPMAVRAASSPVSRTLMRGSGLLKATGFGELDAGLPDPMAHQAWIGTHRPASAIRARIGLFIGCTAEIADAETVEAAIRVLTSLGVCVEIPRNQVCCGALAGHSGDLARASELRERNLSAFESADLDAVISLASGCGSTLQEYDRAATEKGTVFAGKVMDIGRFLAEWWPEDFGMKPLPAKAVLHTPCTLKNVMRADQYPALILRRIPELQLFSAGGTTHCCGAAGSYMLEHPAMAKQLRDDLLPRLISDEPNYLLTSNVGCAIHLRAGLKAIGRSDIRVMHPVALLEKALPG